MSSSKRIRQASHAAGAIAAVMAFIIAPYEGKAFTLVLTGTCAFMAWMICMGIGAALQELANCKKAAEIACRERKLNVIEITKKGRSTTWRQAR